MSKQGVTLRRLPTRGDLSLHLTCERRAIFVTGQLVTLHEGGHIEHHLRTKSGSPVKHVRKRMHGVSETTIALLSIGL